MTAFLSRQTVRVAVVCSARSSSPSPSKSPAITTLVPAAFAIGVVAVTALLATTISLRPSPLRSATVGELGVALAARGVSCVNAPLLLLFTKMKI